MRKYEREKYTLKSYVHEKFRLDMYNENLNTERTIYADSLEELYFKAKKFAEQGYKCSIWELKYEFE